MEQNLKWDKVSFILKIGKCLIFSRVFQMATSNFQEIEGKHDLINSGLEGVVYD